MRNTKKRTLEQLIKDKSEQVAGECVSSPSHGLELSNHIVFKVCTDNMDQLTPVERMLYSVVVQTRSEAREIVTNCKNRADARVLEAESELKEMKEKLERTLASAARGECQICYSRREICPLCQNKQFKKFLNYAALFFFLVLITIFIIAAAKQVWWFMVAHKAGVGGSELLEIVREYLAK